METAVQRPLTGPGPSCGDGVGQSLEGPVEMFIPILEFLSEVVDLVGVAIVAVGAIKFLVRYGRIELRRITGHECASEIQSARRLLGSYILVALEFMIVSDVINSVTSKELESLAYLGGIVVLRTAMGFFLERELREEAAE